MQLEVSSSPPRSSRPKRSVDRRQLTAEELIGERLSTVSRPAAGLLLGVKATRIGTLIQMRVLEEIVVIARERRIRLVTLDSVDSYLSHRRGQPSTNLPVAWRRIVDAVREDRPLKIDDLLTAFGWSARDPHARTRVINLLVDLTTWSWTTHRVLAGLMVAQSTRSRRPHRKLLSISRELLDDAVTDDAGLIGSARTEFRTAVEAGRIGPEFGADPSERLSAPAVSAPAC